MDNDISRLDYFAGMALQGLTSINPVMDADTLADRAVNFAIALTNRLDKEQRKNEFCPGVTTQQQMDALLETLKRRIDTMGLAEVFNVRSTNGSFFMNDIEIELPLNILHKLNQRGYYAALTFDARVAYVNELIEQNKVG